MRAVLPTTKTISPLLFSKSRALRPRVFLVLVLCVIGYLARTNGAEAQAGVSNTSIPAPSATYKIDDLGEFAHLADDVTVSLNNAGAVAYWVRENDTVHAMLWQDGHATSVEQVPGYPNSIAHAINRQGDLAGWMNTSENPVDSLSTTRGFVRQGKSIQFIAGLGGRDSRVFGLNDHGIAVGSADLAPGTRHAFTTSGSSTIDLGTLPSGTSSTAYAINNAGLIVGAADIKNKAYHAVLWTNRKIVDLGELPPGVGSSARAINDRGQIAGFSDTPDGVHAFLYTAGTMRDLGTLGSDPSEASGINNHGDVVGASNLTNSIRHAFLWRSGRMIDLNALLPRGSPWILLNAFSINDRGQIVCSARRKGESPHLLLLTPQ
jgi:probable HAF family extracellular repeat protein